MFLHFKNRVQRGLKYILSIDSKRVYFETIIFSYESYFRNLQTTFSRTVKKSREIYELLENFSTKSILRVSETRRLSSTIIRANVPKTSKKRVVAGTAFPLFSSHFVELLCMIRGND